MSVWSIETVDVEVEIPSSSDDHVSHSLFESDGNDDDDDGPCDSTTTENFDRLMEWLELSIPDQQMVNTDAPVGDGYPDQSCWVEEQQQEELLEDQENREEDDDINILLNIIEN